MVPPAPPAGTGLPPYFVEGRAISRHRLAERVVDAFDARRSRNGASVMPLAQRVYQTIFVSALKVRYRGERESVWLLPGFD